MNKQVNVLVIRLKVALVALDPCEYFVQKVLGAVGLVLAVVRKPNNGDPMPLTAPKQRARLSQLRIVVCT